MIFVFDLGPNFSFFFFFGSSQKDKQVLQARSSSKLQTIVPCLSSTRVRLKFTKRLELRIWPTICSSILRKICFFKLVFVTCALKTWWLQRELSTSIKVIIFFRFLVFSKKNQDLDVTFSNQRECKFLLKLIESCETYNSDALTLAVKDYNQITPLDNWKTTMLLRIKQSIGNGGQNEEDLT